MAIYNLDNYLEKDGLGFPLNFRRGNPNPLDNSSVWGSLASAQNYAQTDPVAYVGQILTVVEDVVVGETTVKTATAYIIDNEAGDLKEVGSSPVGDEKTITVSEDGTVSLYGISGLALTREEDDGTTTKINYQPLLVDGKLTWVEPSATTVEGLATEIEGLKTRINIIENTIGKTAEGDAEATGLIKDVADNTSAIESLQGLVGDTKVSEAISTAVATEKTRAEEIESGLETRLKAVEIDYLKTADKTELSEAIDAAEESAVDRVLGYLAEEVVNEKYDTLKEVAAWIESDTTNSAELISRVSDIESDYLKGADKTEIQGAIDNLEAFVGTLPEGTTSENVIAYIQEVVDALKISDYAKVTDLTTLAGRVTNVEGLIGGTPVSEQITKAISTKVDKVDGSRLLTSDEAAKLEKLVLGDNGEVSVSGKVAAGNVDGLDAWITARAGTLEGLSENNLTDTLLSKLDGIAEGAQVNVIDEVSDEFTITGKTLSVNTVAQEKITGLADALAGKVDAQDGYRLISESEHEKLAKIEGNAQVNVLEGVKVNGTPLDIFEKTVDIPVANTTLFGVVMSSIAENKVTVAEDGTMEVNSLNVNKLVQTEGDTLVLDGGASI